MNDKAIEAMQLALEAMKLAAVELDSPYTSETPVERKLYAASVALREVLAQQQAQQVSAREFVKLVDGKEEMVGLPVYWAQWPTEAKK